MSKDSKSNYQRVEVDIKKYNVPNLDAIGKIHGIFERTDGTGSKIVVGTSGAIGLDGKEKRHISKSQEKRLKVQIKSSKRKNSK